MLLFYSWHPVFHGTWNSFTESLAIVVHRLGWRSLRCSRFGTRLAGSIVGTRFLSFLFVLPHGTWDNFKDSQSQASPLRGATSLLPRLRCRAASSRRAQFQSQASGLVPSRIGGPTHICPPKQHGNLEAVAGCQPFRFIRRFVTQSSGKKRDRPCPWWRAELSPRLALCSVV